MSPASPNVYKDVPPLRASPFTADEKDGERVRYVKQFWHSQDAPLRLRDRQVEENVRMLCGQQWAVWSDLLNKFVDVSTFAGADEERWRQRPTLNKLLYWYILTHSRLTENPPVISFLPSSGDRFDAMLAEVADPIFKTKWQDAGMLEVIDRLMAWLIPGGRAHLKSRIDPNRGKLVTFRGPGLLSLLDPSGSPVLGPDGMPIQAAVEDAAYDRDGNPVTTLFQDEHGLGYGEPEGAVAHSEKKGDLVVDVLSTLEVRGTWGNDPWHMKPWHVHRTFMTPEQAYEAFGVDCTPDVRGGDAQGPGELQRMMLGSGFFGAASSVVGAEFDGGIQQTDYVSVYELWQAPGRFPGTEETEASPGGRLTIVAGDKVVRDGARFGRFKYTSPIRCFDFVNLPGRPSGTSPQEMFNPAQKAFNRTSGQILQHAALCADPKAIIHESTGIEEGQWTNEPGDGIIVQTAPGVTAVEYVAPPQLGEDAWRSQQFLAGFISETGATEGAEGRPPTRNSSGELIKELRHNSDRPIAATTRRAALELGRTAEDWFVLLPLILDEEEVLAYAGEDQILRTVTVQAALFEQGSVNVRADIESMLPEGRGERQERIWTMYNAGIFGLPGSPEAIKAFLEYARFPHMSRTARPGGVNRITAEQNVGLLVRGTPSMQIPLFDFYDTDTHLAVITEFMSAPEFLRLDPMIQQELHIHRARIMEIQAVQMERMLEQQMAIDAANGQTQNAIAPKEEGSPAEKPAPAQAVA